MECQGKSTIETYATFFLSQQPSANFLHQPSNLLLSNWRSLSRDSRSGTAWKNIYDSFDGIHPWHVGRWSSINAFENFYSGTIKADAEYCAKRDIIYMPTQWAGFSWYNLKDYAFPVNQVPRLGGRFMWKQAYRYSADSNIKAIWMAQVGIFLQHCPLSPTLDLTSRSIQLFSLTK